MKKRKKSWVILKTGFGWFLCWFIKLSHCDYFYRIGILSSRNKCFTSKYFLNCTFRQKLSLNTLLHLSLLFNIFFQFQVTLMEYFKSLDILRKGSSFIHYFLQLIVLFFYQLNSFILLKNHILYLSRNLLTKSLNLWIFYP